MDDHMTFTKENTFNKAKQLVGLRRLEKLALGLKSLRIPKNKPQFDMGTYGHACGTPACALGWATNLVPEAKLKLVKNSAYIGYEVIGPTGEYCDCAAAEAFRITVDDACGLFGTAANFSASKSEVVKGLLKFIKERRKELANEK